MPILRSIFLRCLYFILLVGNVFQLSAQLPKVQEYQIKAAFLFNFTQFVDWPAHAFPKEESPFIVGVLGDNPFNTYLNELVEGEKVHGHPLVVRHFNNIDEVNSHVLFINIDDQNKLKQVLKELKGKSILTVGDASGFIQQGGMIRFITVNKKIQFQINPEATKEGNLTVSSKVLRVAEIVTPDQKR